MNDNNDTANLKNYQQPWLCRTANTIKKLGTISDSDASHSALTRQPSDLSCSQWTPVTCDNVHSAVSQATCIIPCLELEEGRSAAGATVVPDAATQGHASLLPEDKHVLFTWIMGTEPCPVPSFSQLYTNIISRHLLLRDF